MYIIYYMTKDGRIDIMHCRDKETLKICYTALCEEGCAIRCIKDIRGEKVEWI